MYYIKYMCYMSLNVCISLSLSIYIYIYIHITNTLINYEAPPGAMILLHACAHNPTGVDPTEDQWRP